MTTPLFLQITGDGDLVLAVSARASGGFAGYFGPFPDSAALEEAKAAMLDAGIDLGDCEVLPLRKVVTQP